MKTNMNELARLAFYDALPDLAKWVRWHYRYFMDGAWHLANGFTIQEAEAAISTLTDGEIEFLSKQS